MKTQTFSHFVSDDLYLVGSPVRPDAPSKTVDAPVDTIAVIDVSGSMSADLPEFKRSLKNMLPRVLKGGDTFSLIYFSGPGQCAQILDRVQIRPGGEGLLDVSSVHETIDRLDTIGLTAFTDPLDLAAKLAATLGFERPKARRHVVFMSDGYDNTSRGGSQTERRRNILAAITKLAGHVDRVTTMGVGWCCDQSLLQDMASAAGGSFLFASDIGRYTRDFETAASKRPDGARRKHVVLEGDPIDGVAFTVTADGEITQYTVDAGAVLVPENVDGVWYLSERRVGGIVAHVSNTKGASLAAAYAALVLFAQRARRKVVRALAFGIGDARFVKIAKECFGPQRYNALADMALEAVAGRGRFTDGVSTEMAIDPNAYTVLDALFALARGANRICPDDPRFQYTPITRGRVNAGGVVSDADAKAIATMGTTLASKSGAITTGSDLALLDDLHGELGAFAAALGQIKAQKARKTSYSYIPAPNGYPVDGLVFASVEANVSLRIVRPILVDVRDAKASLDEKVRCAMPDQVPSKRYQSFTVVTGRVLNLSVLTVILDEQTWVEFARAGLVSGPYRREVVAIDLSSLPLVNDGMVEGLSATKTVLTAWRLEGAKAALKVANTVRTAHLPRKANEVAAWLHTIGFEPHEIPSLVAWLDQLGIRDGGYQPPSTLAAKKQDPRVSWILDISIPGLSDLPSVKEVRQKVAKIEAWQKQPPKGRAPKLTLGERLMLPTIEAFDRFVADEKIKLDHPTERDIELIAAWVASVEAAHEPTRHDCLHDLGKAAIIAVTGGEWFEDLKPGESTVKLATAHGEIECAVAIKDVEIPL